MDLMQNILLIVGGIVILLFLRQVMKKSRRAPEFETMYRRVLLSDEHKVKGRFG